MPHFIDRAKPGVIAVTRNGTRFANEANSYHDFVQAMVAACEGERRPRLSSSATTGRSANTGSAAFRLSRCRSGDTSARAISCAAGPSLSSQRRRHRAAALRRPWRRSTPRQGTERIRRSGKERRPTIASRATRCMAPNPCIAPIEAGLTMRSRSSSATSAPTQVSRRIAMRASSIGTEADRRALCGRQRHRQHHGRRLSGRRDHSRPRAHLRLHCRQTYCGRGWSLERPFHGTNIIVSDCSKSNMPWP